MCSGIRSATPVTTHAAVRVAAEDDVGELLPLDQVEDILDMRVQVHVAGEQVGVVRHPVSVGVKTSWPAAWSALRTRFQHQLPCHAP